MRTDSARLLSYMDAEKWQITICLESDPPWCKGVAMKLQCWRSIHVREKFILFMLPTLSKREPSKVS